MKSPDKKPPPPTRREGLLPGYLALGDSYTIGEGAAAAERWPTQLVGLLRARSEHLAEPTYLAQTGWTTGELLAALANRGDLARNYALVSLLIGVNNQYRGQALAQYQAELARLLVLAQGFAGGCADRVLVLSIPDWGQTPFAHDRDPVRIAAEIDEFNAVGQALSQVAGAAFVDITDLTRAAAGDSSQFTADGLHYTGAHMRQWAERAVPVAQRLLS